jgi:hypothetical protein
VEVIVDIFEVLGMKLVLKGTRVTGTAGKN